MIDFAFSDVLADMHVHTLSTIGGMSTIRENLALARRRGLGFLTIVNHASECDVKVFNTMNTIKTDAGIRVISGINIDTLTTSTECQEKLERSGTKFRTLSLNPACGTKLISADDFIGLIEKAVNFYGIDYLCDITEYTAVHIPSAEQRRFSSLLANLCEKRHLTLELNSAKKTDAELFMLIKVLEDCDGKDIRYAFGSKAFYCEDIGTIEETILFAENFNIKKERVMNCDKETLARLAVDYQPTV